MLEGKIALVTGASRGIGRQIAKTLAAKGAFVIVNYNGSAAKAEEVVKEIQAAGGNGQAVQCNVSDFESCKEMLDAVVKEHGRLDILVNNAGITRDNLLMKMSEEDFDAVIQTNLKGVFNCTRHIARQMLKQKSGRIINISSVSGLFFRDKIIHRTPVYDARTFLNFGRNLTKPGEKQFFLNDTLFDLLRQG